MFWLNNSSWGLKKESYRVATGNIHEMTAAKECHSTFRRWVLKSDTAIAFRGGMSITQIAEVLHLSWGQVKTIEKNWLAKEFAYGARLLLEDWCTTARLTKVPELESMARTIEDHMEGILGYWRHGKACNSGAEGFNNKVRWLAKQAYGLRDREYFKLKIYALPDTETTRSI